MTESPPPLPFPEKELRSWRLLEDFRRALATALRAHPDPVRRPSPERLALVEDDLSLFPPSVFPVTCPVKIMGKPFLHCHHRFKNGKDHCYWSIAEKVRTARGPWVQRQLLYLGEINDSQKAAWTKTIAVFDTDRQAAT